MMKSFLVKIGSEGQGDGLSIKCLDTNTNTVTEPQKPLVRSLLGMAAHTCMCSQVVPARLAGSFILEPVSETQNEEGHLTLTSPPRAPMHVHMYMCTHIKTKHYHHPTKNKMSWNDKLH